MSLSRYDWRREADREIRYQADKSRKENGMAKGTVEFKVVTADNGFIVEGGGKSMVAKTDQEIGEAVMAIFKAAGKPEPKKAQRKRRTKEEIAAAKAAAG